MASRRQLVTNPERIGRIVGITNFVATMAAVLLLLIWPKVIGALIAMLTWSREAQDACSAEPGCAVNVVPGGVLPVWWALAWVALIAASVIVCWDPQRWWSSRGRFRIDIFADSTPRWLRVHAGVAAFLCLILVFPGRGITGVWALEYLIAVGAALAVMALATISSRRAKARLGDKEFARLIGPGALGIAGTASATSRRKTARPRKDASS